MTTDYRDVFCIATDSPKLFVAGLTTPQYNSTIETQGEIKMLPFKVKVTPEESAAVQKLLFANGCEWRGALHKRWVDHTNNKYLFVTADKVVTYANDDFSFACSKFTEVTVAQILEHYGATPAENAFTKVDLKDGMRVRFRNDVTAYFRQDFGTFIMANSTTASKLSRYQYNFEHRSSAEWDIMSVYALGELVWERKQKTAEQIELEGIEEKLAALQKRKEELLASTAKGN